MNPQPHPFVGQLGVLIFALLVAYFCFTNKKKTYSFDDKFTIGYILDDQPVIQTQVEEYRPKATPSRSVKTTKKSIPTRLITPVQTKEKQFKFDKALMDDCMSALVSLGTKKSQAKAMTQNIFEKHNPQTVEDFIKFVYIKS